jgi:ribonuclease P protein component
VNPGGRSEGFPKSARLRKRPEFLSLSRAGKKVHSHNFVVIAQRNGFGESRLGITVSGKVGNAVARNRIKRLVREVFRRRRAELGAPVDVLVIAKQGAAAMERVPLVREIENDLNQFKTRLRNG